MSANILSQVLFKKSRIIKTISLGHITKKAGISARLLYLKLKLLLLSYGIDAYL